MDKIYREKFWKADGGDKKKIGQWEKEYKELVKAVKQYIIKDDLWTLYMKNGGTGLNASTGNETTEYYVTLPSNKGGDKWPGPLEKLGQIYRINLKDPLTGEELK